MVVFQANPTTPVASNIGLMGFMPATSTAMPTTNALQEQKKKLLWGNKKQVDFIVYMDLI